MIEILIIGVLYILGMVTTHVMLLFSMEVDRTIKRQFDAAPGLIWFFTLLWPGLGIGLAFTNFKEG